MSTEICAYTIKRHIRSADDVAGEMVEEKTLPFKPKPQTKLVWGSLSEGPEKTVSRLAEAVTERLCWVSELVCVLDGEKSLWRLVHQYFPMAFFVLDIFHVLEHLSEAAHCFYKEKSPEAKRFVRDRLRMLLTGNAGQMIGGLKQILTKRPLSNTQKYTLNKVIGYLERNKQHMRYDVCLERGYPIGSGVIEGACRNLINDRLELTGMRWTVQGAESVIRLRAVYINKDWTDFWRFRRKFEKDRLYGTSFKQDNHLDDEALLKAA
jgi:Transposase